MYNYRSVQSILDSVKFAIDIKLTTNWRQLILRNQDNKFLDSSYPNDYESSAFGSLINYILNDRNNNEDKDAEILELYNICMNSGSHIFLRHKLKCGTINVPVLFVMVYKQIKCPKLITNKRR